MRYLNWLFRARRPVKGYLNHWQFMAPTDQEYPLYTPDEQVLNKEGD